MRNLDLDEENLHIRRTGEGPVFGQLKMLCIGDKLLYEYMLNAQSFIISHPYTTKTTFLSVDFWKKILKVLRNLVIEKIVNDIKNNGGRFGVEIDSTTDISRKHQVSVVLKYANEVENALGEKIFEVNERTVFFKPIANATSINLYNFLSSSLNSIGLNISDITGTHLYVFYIYCRIVF